MMSLVLLYSNRTESARLGKMSSGLPKSSGIDMICASQQSDVVWARCNSDGGIWELLLNELSALTACQFLKEACGCETCRRPSLNKCKNQVQVLHTSTIAG